MDRRSDQERTQRWTFFATMLLLVGCEGASFKQSAAPVPAATSPTVTPDAPIATPPAPTTTPNCEEPAADDLRGLTAEARACLAGGNIYHFATQRCVALTGGSRDNDALRQTVTKLGISTAEIDAAASRGFKLFGWGVKDGGNTVVAQWFDPSEVCSQKRATLLTGCFRLTQNENINNNPTEAEQEQIVRECLGV